VVDIVYAYCYTGVTIKLKGSIVMVDKTIVKDKKLNIKNSKDVIEVAVRKAVKVCALIVLSYLAWKGVADFVHVPHDFAAYVSTAGLLALYLLV
jgi:hypothetical protein